MQTILTVLHLFLAIGIVGLVLIQHGKGADAGAAFGSGASGTVFGARGSGNFLTRSTAILAAMFFATSTALAYYSSVSVQKESLMESAVEQAPVAPEPVRDMPDIPGLPAAAEQSGNDMPEIQTPVAEVEQQPVEQPAQPDTESAPAATDPVHESAALDAGAK